MTYDEAIEYQPNDKEIERELRKHGFTFAEFVSENTRPYTGEKVLNWLGY